MSKKKPESSTARPQEKSRPSVRQRSPIRRERPARQHSSRAAIRETIESMVIAFVLAFLFRTFEAEAFVIPTGSMAPTLMGRHKDVVVPVRLPVSGRAPARRWKDEAGRSEDRRKVLTANCPMCRYTMSVRMKPRSTATGFWSTSSSIDLGTRALGRDRLQVSRRCQDELHQAAGRTARRDRADLPGGPLRQAAGAGSRSTLRAESAGLTRATLQDVHDSRYQPRFLPGEELAAPLAALAAGRRRRTSGRPLDGAVRRTAARVYPPDLFHRRHVSPDALDSLPAPRPLGDQWQSDRASGRSTARRSPGSARS